MAVAGGPWPKGPPQDMNILICNKFLALSKEIIHTYHNLDQLYTPNNQCWSVRLPWSLTWWWCRTTWDTSCSRKTLSSTAKQQNAAGGNEDDGVLSGYTRSLPQPPLRNLADTWWNQPHKPFLPNRVGNTISSIRLWYHFTNYKEKDRRKLYTHCVMNRL
jgi:hypothetical protein